MASKPSKIRQAVMWPAIVWVVTEILFRVVALVSQAANSSFEPNNYAVAAAIGLALGVWAGLAVKMAKGTHLEAIAGGFIVGLGAGIPAVILFGLGAVGFAINMVILSVATAWAGWGLR